MSRLIRNSQRLARVPAGMLVGLVSLFFCLSSGAGETDAGTVKVVATAGLYDQIQQSVAEADFELMASAYHPDAILVSVTRSRPVSQVIPAWKKAGEKLALEGGSASVTFRFGYRQIDESTGFETGIFRYQATDAEGENKVSYVHFESLTIRQGASWVMLMERQKAAASQAEWDALSLAE